MIRLEGNQRRSRKGRRERCRIEKRKGAQSVGRRGRQKGEGEDEKRRNDMRVLQDPKDPSQRKWLFVRQIEKKGTDSDRGGEGGATVKKNKKNPSTPIVRTPPVSASWITGKKEKRTLRRLLTLRKGGQTKAGQRTPSACACRQTGFRTSHRGTRRLHRESYGGHKILQADIKRMLQVNQTPRRSQLTDKAKKKARRWEQGKRTVQHKKGKKGRNGKTPLRYKYQKDRLRQTRT